MYIVHLTVKFNEILLRNLGGVALTISSIFILAERVIILRKNIGSKCPSYMQFYTECP